MRIDYEYISKILDVFLESNSPTVNWGSFSSLHEGEENEDKFVFHIKILQDKNLIASRTVTEDLGIKNINGEYLISIVPWRLTSDGHDFASAITKPSVLSTIKDKFKKEGFSIIIDIAKIMAVKQAEKLLDKHT